jgi:hypothetical protein
MSDQVAVRDSCEIVDLKTGEIVDIATAPTVAVAELATNMADVRAQISDVEKAISTELVARLDRSASWTVRVGDPAVAQWEITAPSPTAATDVYPQDLLQAELAKLIAQGVITTDAASRACKRQLVLTVGVPWSAEPQEIADTLKAATSVAIAGVSVEVLKVETDARPVAQGIAALRKVPGTAEALDAAKQTQPAGARRAKVTRKSREGS